MSQTAAEREARRRAVQQQALYWSHTCTRRQLAALHRAAPTQEYRSAVLLAQRLQQDQEGHSVDPFFVEQLKE